MAGGPRIPRPESQDRQSFKGRTLRGRGGGAAGESKRELGFEAWRKEKRLRATEGTRGGRILDAEARVAGWEFQGEDAASVGEGSAGKGKREHGFEAWRDEKWLRVTGGASSR